MKESTFALNEDLKYSESTLKIAKMWGCFENPFVNDTSLDPRPLPSLHMRRRYSALSTTHAASAATSFSGSSRSGARVGENPGNEVVALVGDTGKIQQLIGLSSTGRSSSRNKSYIISFGRESEILMRRLEKRWLAKSNFYAAFGCNSRKALTQCSSV